MKIFKQERKDQIYQTKMNEDNAIEELAAYRDRLVAAREKSAETASSSLRVISFGLSLTIYSYIFNPIEHSPWYNYRTAFLLAAIFGVIGSVFDVLQSFVEKRAAVKVLEYLQRDRNLPGLPQPKCLEALRSSSGGHLANIFLVLRTICVFCGCTAILCAVLLVLAKD